MGRKGEKNPGLSERNRERNRENNPSKRPEVRAKRSEYMKNGGATYSNLFNNSPEQIEKQRERMRKSNPMKCPEAIAKMSMSKKGKKCPEHSKWMKDHNPSKRSEVRAKMSKAKKGEKNPFWQGGISFEPYGLEFNDELKEQIRKRDNYQCQECGYFQKDLGYNLSVHHIDYNKKNNDPVNLISLCKNCHRKTGFNRDNWIDYYKQKVFTMLK